MKDQDPLRSVLGTWRHDPAPAPEFSKDVWSRIRAAETAPAPAGIIRFPFALPLPLAASIAMIFAGLAGTGAALAFNRAQSTDRMAAAYVRMIDPVQMTSDHTHPDS